MTIDGSLPEQISPPEKQDTFTKEVEEQEPSSYGLLPHLNDFAPQLQDQLRLRFENIQKQAAHISTLASNLDLASKNYQEARIKLDLILSEGLSQKELDREFEALVVDLERELDLLTKANQRLLQGKDISDIIDLTLATDDIKSEDIKRYGRTKNPVTLFKQKFVYPKEKGNDNRRKTYFSIQETIFRVRKKRLENLILSYFSSRQTIKTPGGFPSIPLDADDFDQQVVQFQTGIDDHIANSKKDIRNNLIKNKVAERLIKWLGTNSQKLDALDSSDSSIYTSSKTETRDELQFIIQKINEDCQKYIEEGIYLENPAAIYKSQFTNAVNKCMTSIREQVHDVSTYPSGFCSLTQEEYEVILSIENTVTTVMNMFKQTNYDEALLAINSLKQEIAGFTARSENLPQNQELLWHVVSLGIMVNDIIIPGKLNSRSAQMEDKGWAYFNSAGFFVKKNPNGTYDVRKIHADTRVENFTVTESELTNLKGMGGKSWSEEYSQICFTTDGPYMYTNGIALCVSGASLLARSQFMEADGLHLFDKDYTGVPTSKGFSLDLRNEPHIILVEKEKYASFLATLSKYSHVLGDTQTTEDWINKHVIVVDNLQSAETINLVKREFFLRFNIDIKKGHFMLSGVDAPETPGNKGQKKPLVKYQ